jgi:hypothetical protein
MRKNGISPDHTLDGALLLQLFDPGDLLLQRPASAKARRPIKGCGRPTTRTMDSRRPPLGAISSSISPSTTLYKTAHAANGLKEGGAAFGAKDEKDISRLDELYALIHVPKAHLYWTCKEYSGITSRPLLPRRSRRGEDAHVGSMGTVGRQTIYGNQDSRIDPR